MASDTLSVLICTYNRHILLRQALLALVEQTIEKPDQIMIVNAGDDRADEVAREFVGRESIDIRLVKTTNKGPAGNRNIGIPLCWGDLIAITDDDAEVAPDWVSLMKLTHREHPEAGAVGGRVVGIDSHRSLVSRVADIAYFPISQKPAYVTTLPTVNISYKRQAVEKTGLLDEALIYGEDVDYNWRLQRLGYRVFYQPTIVVKHHNPSRVSALARRHFDAGRYYYCVRQKWPDMYSAYPRGLGRPRDLLKGVNFLAGAFYQPFFTARHLTRWLDRMAALPILMACQIVWRGGIVYQMVSQTLHGNSDK